MIPASCSFRILLSEAAAETDLESVDLFYKKSTKLKGFFTKKAIGGLPFAYSDSNTPLSVDFIEKLNISGSEIIVFEDIAGIPKRTLTLSGQIVAYDVKEAIPFSQLKDEIESYIIPIVRVANCNIWTFALKATFNLDTIDKECGFIPKTLGDSRAWNCSFAKVLPWQGSGTDLYLIQKDFSAQKREDGIKITLSCSAQRYPDVSPTLSGEEGDYVLGNVFQAAYDRAVEEITEDYKIVRG